MKKRTKTPLSKRDYYKNLILEHKSDLSKARRLISMLLDKLQSEIESVESGYLRLIHERITDDEPAKAKAKFAKQLSSMEIKFWWGEKESAASILAKMTALLLKLIPLELEIARTDLSKADLAELEEISTKIKLEKEDIEIIDMYAERLFQTRK